MWQEMLHLASQIAWHRHYEANAALARELSYLHLA